MTTRFKNAYDALYKAFMNGTLAKGSCSACAIGNIVSAAQKGTIEIINNEVFSSTRSHFWSKIFITENKSKAPKMLFFIKDKVEMWKEFNFYTMLICGIFGALGFIHLLLFVFYRKAIYNLYFSTYNFSISLIIRDGLP